MIRYVVGFGIAAALLVGAWSQTLSTPADGEDSGIYMISERPGPSPGPPEALNASAAPPESLQRLRFASPAVSINRVIPGEQDTHNDNTVYDVTSLIPAATPVAMSASLASGTNAQCTWIGEGWYPLGRYEPAPPASGLPPVRMVLGMNSTVLLQCAEDRSRLDLSPRDPLGAATIKVTFDPHSVPPGVPVLLPENPLLQVRPILDELAGQVIDLHASRSWPINGTGSALQAPPGAHLVLLLDEASGPAEIYGGGSLAVAPLQLAQGDFNSSFGLSRVLSSSVAGAGMPISAGLIIVPDGSEQPPDLGALRIELRENNVALWSTSRSPSDDSKPFPGHLHVMVPVGIAADFAYDAEWTRYPNTGEPGIQLSARALVLALPPA